MSKNNEELQRKTIPEELGAFSSVKALAHIDRLKTIQKGNIPPPVTVEVDLADGFCNQAYPHCFFGTHKKPENIFFPTKMSKPLAREFKKLGVRAVEFPGGGEPTTHPDFIENINNFASVELPLGLVTNGVLFKRILPVLDKFQWIRISLDAATKETYLKTHGKDQFDWVIKGIKEMVKRSKRTTIGLGYLLMPNNWEESHQFLSLAEELGVDYVQFRPASKVGWELSPIRNIVVDHVERTKDLTDKLTVHTSFHKWHRVNTGRRCPTCDTSSLVAIIKADGTIPHCVLKRDEPSLFFREYSSK